MDQTRSESTRYLSAAAYLDHKFRRWLHQHVIDDEHHAIGRPAGVDLATVVRHCLAAERRRFHVELGLGALVLVFIYVVLATPELRGLVGLPARSALSHPTGSLVVVSVLVLLGVSWAIVLRDQWDTKFRILGRDLARATLRTDASGVNLPSELERRLTTASDDPANN